MTGERTPLPAAIADSGVLAIVRGVYDRRTLMSLGSALLGAGVSAIEVTANSPGAVEGIAALRQITGLAVGAGTILSVADAERFVAAGADFLVMPHVDGELIRWGSANDIATLPGAFTATEVLTAWRAGASAVKLFPASPPGPENLRALRGPLDDVAFVPTGGVTAHNTEAFVAAGAVAVGVSSWLIPPSAALRLETLRDRARELTEAVRRGRAAVIAS